MKKIIAAAAAVLSAAAFAELSADFSSEIGPVRPEIHSSGFGPTVCSQTAQDLEDVKSMGFKKLNSSVILPDNAATRGQIRLINHMVKVEEIEE